MSKVLIKVDNLSKKFCRSLKRSMYYGVKDTLKTFFGRTTDGMIIRPSEFLALNHVSFELRRGETLGIIGINGSGKSTLLRLLSGIFPPDSGKIEINGSIGSLIAVGAGFHPHMTGKQNIYLNGTLLGMSREKIQNKFDEIVEFAEISDALDAPVATYSSGMKVRLGFSIAIHLEPEIMLVDEVLSVGDLGFRNKCLRKMHEYKKNHALIFVSHALEQVRVLCDRVVVLNKGEVIFDGDTVEGILKYEELIDKKTITNNNSMASSRSKEDIGIVYESEGDTIQYIKQGLIDENNNDLVHGDIEIGRELLYFCDFSITRPLDEIYFTFAVLAEDNHIAFWLSSNDTDKFRFTNLSSGTYRLNVQIPAHHLNTGVYLINFSIKDAQTIETYQRNIRATHFRVIEPRVFSRRGLIYVNENWELIKIN